jgi:hypothetical protein
LFSDKTALLDEALQLLKRRSSMLSQLHVDIQTGLDDLAAGRKTTIANPEEAKAFAEQLKHRGRGIYAEGEISTP